jgi:FkbM family methyltransferase
MVRPFVDELEVIMIVDDERKIPIAREYGARICHAEDGVQASALWLKTAIASGADWIWLPEWRNVNNSNESDTSLMRSKLREVADDIFALVVNRECNGRLQDILFCLVRNCHAALSKVSTCHTVESLIASFSGHLQYVTLDGRVAGNITCKHETEEQHRGQVPPKSQRTHLPVEQWLEPWVPQSGRVFIDVGANVGIWTRWLAPTFDHVFAIEPNPQVVDELKRGLPGNVTVLNVAAWSHATSVTFSQFAASVHLSAYFKDEGIHTGTPTGEIELPCFPIDELSIDGPIDFIKCDTEGAEVRCLQGAEGTIRRHRPWLLIEIHSIENFADVSRLLAEWGYVFSIIRDPNYEPFSGLWYAHCWLSCQAGMHGTCGLVDGKA